MLVEFQTSYGAVFFIFWFLLEGFDSYRRWVGGFIWYFELRIGDLKILIDMGFGLKFLRIGKLRV